MQSLSQSQASLARLQEEANARAEERAVELAEAAMAGEMEKRRAAEAKRADIEARLKAEAAK